MTVTVTVTVTVTDGLNGIQTMLHFMWHLNILLGLPIFKKCHGFFCIELTSGMLTVHRSSRQQQPFCWMMHNLSFLHSLLQLLQDVKNIHQLYILAHA